MPTRALSCHAQVMLRSYNCLEEVWLSYDVATCQAAYDGTNVYCSQEMLLALDSGTMLIYLNRLTGDVVSRLPKCGTRSNAPQPRLIHRPPLPSTLHACHYNALRFLFSLQSSSPVRHAAGMSHAPCPPACASTQPVTFFPKASWTDWSSCA
jgi:hypothetical protein